MASHTFNPITKEVEAGRITPSLKQHGLHRFPGQIILQNKILCQKQSETRKKNHSCSKLFTALWMLDRSCKFPFAKLLLKQSPSTRRCLNHYACPQQSTFQCGFFSQFLPLENLLNSRTYLFDTMLINENHLMYFVDFFRDMELALILCGIFPMVQGMWQSTIQCVFSL